jgi:hypothetical protein
MVAEGRLGPRDPNVTDPSSWWGILPSSPPGETTRGALAGLSALSIITLCLCWGVLVCAVLAGRVTTRAGLTAAAAWSLPFAVGPPLFSRDAYAYAAQGELARLGLDPATHGVSALLTSGTADGSGPAFVRAVDPRWADTHSPYGGAAVAIEKAAAAVGGGPAGTVVALRIVAALATVALVILSLRLSGPAAGRRAAVAVVVAANPVVVIHLVGGAHLDAVVAALVVAALVLDRAGYAAGGGAWDGCPSDGSPWDGSPSDGSPWDGSPSDGSPSDGDPCPAASRWATARTIVLGAAATGLACLAGNVKATALLAVGWLVVAHLLAARRTAHPVRAGIARLAADAVAVAVVSALSMAAAGFGPTWIHSLSTSGALSTGIAPASILAAVVDGLLGLADVRPATGATLWVTRGLCLAGAAAVVLALAVRAWRRAPGVAGVPVGGPDRDATDTGRDLTGPEQDLTEAGHDPADRLARSPLDDRPDLAVLGYGGLAVALGNPVVYPWYLAMCLPALAIIAAMFAGSKTRDVAEGSAGGETAGETAADEAASRRGGETARRSLSGLVPMTAAGRTFAGTAVVSSWLCLATLPPLAATWRLLGPGGVAAVVTGLGLVAAAGVGALVAPRRPAPPTSTP